MEPLGFSAKTETNRTRGTAAKSMHTAFPYGTAITRPLCRTGLPTADASVAFPRQDLSPFIVPVSRTLSSSPLIWHARSWLSPKLLRLVQRHRRTIPLQLEVFLPPHRIPSPSRREQEVMSMPSLAEDLSRVRQEVERTQRHYQIEDARGIPMSVRERYERRLSELTETLRVLETQRNSDTGLSAR